MRLHILCDLHLEFGRTEIPATNADVVVLAGDIDAGKNGLEWAKSHFGEKPVIYVLGNHEFYRHAIPELTDTLREEAEGSQIRLLENKAIELAGYTFLGCTLWTDFAVNSNPQAAMQAAADMMNDYRIIRSSTENRRLRPRDTRKMHQESVSWLKDQLAKCDPGRTVVVTHHAPSQRSEAPYNAGSPLVPAFTSNMDSLIEQSGVPLWIHGHTHPNVDYKLGATRVLSNQRGYVNQICPGFDSGLVVEV